MNPSPIDEIRQRLLAARGALSRGDSESAIRILDSLVESYPDVWEVHFAKGSMYQRLGRYQQALESFESALERSPDNGEALKAAAESALQLRLPGTIEKYARRLATLDPRSVRAYFMLSFAFGLRGQWFEAFRWTQECLKLEPRNPDYVTAKAQILASSGANTLAIESYRKALELRPASQIANELAELLMKEGRLSEARDLLEKYSVGLPEEARPHLLLARIYTESKLFDEAEQHWESARRHGIPAAEIAETRAQCEVWVGRSEVAERILTDALEQGFEAANLYGALAPIKKFSPVDAALVQRMEDLTKRETLNPSNLQFLHFALGKAYSDLGDYGTAMAQYDEANRLRRVINPVPFDSEEWKRNIDFAISYFTESRMQELRSRGPSNSQPLFVIGMIRSGTSLIQQILSCHSRIKAVGEMAFWKDRYYELTDPEKVRFDEKRGRELAQEFLQILASFDASARYVIDKHPLNVLIAQMLHCLLPGSKMVHLKRHPVDNLLSIWMMPDRYGMQYISDKTELVLAFREYLRLAEHLENVLPAASFRTFRYEEITSRPESGIPEMLNFLDLEFEGACLSPEKSETAVRTPSAYQVRSPINPGSQEKWKKFEPWLGEFAELLDGQ